MLKTAAGYYREIHQQISNKTPAVAYYRVIHAINTSHIRRPVRTAHPTSPSSEIIPYEKRSPYFQSSLLHTKKSTIYHKPALYSGTRRVRHTHRLFSFAASDMLKTAAGYYREIHPQISNKIPAVAQHREIHITNISHICRPVRTAHPTRPASKIIPYKKRSPYFRTSLLHTKKSTTYNKPALYPGARRVRHTHRLFFRCKRHAKSLAVSY